MKVYRIGFMVDTEQADTTMMVMKVEETAKCYIPDSPKLKRIRKEVIGQVVILTKKHDRYLACMFILDLSGEKEAIQRMKEDAESHFKQIAAETAAALNRIKGVVA